MHSMDNGGLKGRPAKYSQILTLLVGELHLNFSKVKFRMNVKLIG